MNYNNNISNSIIGQSMNLTIPDGMYLPIELFGGDSHQVEKDYEPSKERDPTKRFINAFYYLTEYLYFHNTEHLETKTEEHQSLLPYQYIERVRDTLVEDNNEFLRMLYLCFGQAEDDIAMLRGKIDDVKGDNPLQYGEILLDSPEKVREVIDKLTNDLESFRREIEIRERGPQEDTEDNNYSRTCQSIDELNILIDTVKQLCK